MADTKFAGVNKAIEATQFGGMDYLSESAGLYRSSDSVNMISDGKGNVVKRSGYRLRYQLSAGVLGMYTYKNMLLVHCGQFMAAFSHGFTVAHTLSMEMALNKSSAFCYNDKIYILDGENFWQYDGVTFTNMKNIAYHALTAYDRSWNGQENKKGEKPNLLCDKRKNLFYIHPTIMNYHLDSGNLKNGSVKINLVGEDGTETAVASNRFTVDYVTGSIVLITPQGVSGSDQLAVYFEVEHAEPSKIIKCRFGSGFSGFNNGYAFLSGNPAQPNIEYCCAINDITYFPEYSYNEVGDAQAILGYMDLQNYNIILKAGGNGQVRHYIRATSEQAPIEYPFVVKQAAFGPGGISKSGFCTAFDRPLYVSKQGIIVVSSTNVDMHLAISNCSQLINSKLCKEQLEDSRCIYHKGKIYVFLPGCVYVADTSMTYKGPSEHAQYEWYYWDNIISTAAVVYEDVLYFGDEQGNIFSFNNPGESNEFKDHTQPVRARWATSFYDYEDAYNYKNLKSVLLKLMPASQSSVEIYGENQDLDSILLAPEHETMYSSPKAPKIISVPIRENLVQFYKVTFYNHVVNQPFGIQGIKFIYSQGKKIRNGVII